MNIVEKIIDDSKSNSWRSAIDAAADYVKYKWGWSSLAVGVEHGIKQLEPVSVNKNLLDKLIDMSIKRQFNDDFNLLEAEIVKRMNAGTVSPSLNTSLNTSSNTSSNTSLTFPTYIDDQPEGPTPAPTNETNSSDQLGGPTPPTNSPDQPERPTYTVQSFNRTVLLNDGSSMIVEGEPSVAQRMEVYYSEVPF